MRRPQIGQNYSTRILQVQLNHHFPTLVQDAAILKVLARNVRQTTICLPVIFAVRNITSSPKFHSTHLF